MKGTKKALIDKGSAAKTKPSITAKQREARQLKKALQGLCDNVLVAVSQLDAAMKEPDSVLRGKRIATIANWLEMRNDGVRYSHLGVDFRKDDKVKAVIAAVKRAK